jgi:two-component system sensor histidine kinase HydH
LTDVDEEVDRLNRVVNDVLDFARPIRFEYASSDINALCADAEHATRADTTPIAVKLSPDPALRPLITDGERLRTALVNILTNAKHAVTARRDVDGSTSDGGPDIEISTAGRDDGIRITIRDRGLGVSPQDMPHVFDPYFTTKRTGSGLGLAIAKNIIEGLGGSIVIESQSGTGTEIRIDLPNTGRAGLAVQDPPHMQAPRLVPPKRHQREGGSAERGPERRA